MAKAIPLTQGQVAVVDDADYAWLSQWKWFAHYDPTSDGFYAVRSITFPGTKGYYKNGKSRRGRVLMHKLITGYDSTDHADRNGLNNQRYNLRDADAVQQAANQGLGKDNTSGCKGVQVLSPGRFRAIVHAKRRKVFDKVFRDKDEACAAYKREAEKHHGEFAHAAKETK